MCSLYAVSVRLILPLFAAAFSLGCTACTRQPIVVSVATDSRIFQGNWSGIPRKLGTGEALGEVKVNVAATYLSPTSYALSGTLAIDGVTYTLEGAARAFDGARLKPQMSQVVPTIQWNTELRHGDQIVGNLFGSEYIAATDPKIDSTSARLVLKSQAYDLLLRRVP